MHVINELKGLVSKRETFNVLEDETGGSKK